MVLLFGLNLCCFVRSHMMYLLFFWLSKVLWFLEIVFLNPYQLYIQIFASFWVRLAIFLIKLILITVVAMEFIPRFSFIIPFSSFRFLFCLLFFDFFILIHLMIFIVMLISNYNDALINRNYLEHLDHINQEFSYASFMFFMDSLRWMVLKFMLV